VFSKKSNSKTAEKAIFLNEISENEKAFHKYYILCKGNVFFFSLAS